RDWPTPTTEKQLQGFLGAAGFYRRFIHRFSHITTPLTDLLKKGTSFAWGPSQQSAFDELKRRLTSAPVLAIASPDFPFVLQTDASDFAIGGVLMQDQGKGLQPVGFFSRKLSDAERGYSVPDREALATVSGLQYWRHYLHGAPHSTVFSDQISVKYLKTQPVINQRAAQRARWINILEEFNVTVDYIKGKSNVVADALSRRPDYLSTIITARQPADWLAQVISGYESCPEARAIVQAIHKGTAKHYTFRHGYIVRSVSNTAVQLYIPDSGSLRQVLLHQHHYSLLAGHFGVDKTIQFISRPYSWPTLQRDVRHYIKTCPSCSANKSSNQRPAGLLQPIPAPTRKFGLITLDFVTHLPPCDGLTAILIMVDKLTKRILLAPCTDNTDAPATAKLFYESVVRHQGLPDAIISDRGPQFTSAFWHSLHDLCDTKVRHSTAYHPQSDGQSEKAVRTVVDALRCLCLDYPNWVQALPGIEFAYNNSVNPTTGETPFKLIYGEHPRAPPTLQLDRLRSVPNQHAVDFAVQHRSLIDRALFRMSQAQERQARYANTRRRDVSFDIGDKVWLSTVNLPLKGPRKLAPKWYGPCTIVAKIGSVSYKLQLPSDWRIHPVFHVSLLKRYEASSKFPRTMFRPPPDLEYGNSVYEVETILDRRETFLDGDRRRTPVVEYFIKWAGYAAHESTWEPASNLNDAGKDVQRMLRAMDRLAKKTQRHNDPPPQRSAQPTDPPSVPGHRYNLRHR
ncbi:MAG: RNase H-like domain-containing protein, partial [Caldilinea sp.]|nr:RNase H-like domain-containing protein [Caldilinea sp.]